ncbi:MAG: NUDIX hydrolase YfcD [Proteobacteria bacterium]|jgi:8-oxo-dGTP pyrophosphatase MutT (NUDIX family)|nr:NUDIX hydrolase YfcD [Desulfocapsa sp.]MBU3944554.1 NUDIX hydrolase YfcD [Pseudomonadota bacterium]MCG2745006.1 NUDIX hydrolase YfcD [Desulfobacteraceae bacterium]MBU3983172.1 NUDIX hydrolase YfcD [Pseudomonadota bacterium]MBU4029610.1 NUDIX hydrolase YfcD [Pseudomonadota bacterium]
MYLPEQEMVQIVDRDNREIEILPRHLMRSRGLIHRASYILVFNAEQEIFVQKRTTTKDIYPGYWDVAAGGVVLGDESYEHSASRELAEELGVSGIPLVPLFDHYFEDARNRVWGRVFRCTHEGPFTLQPEEVEYGRFMAIQQILQASLQEPFTPDGILILQQI